MLVPGAGLGRVGYELTLAGDGAWEVTAVECSRLLAAGAMGIFQACGVLAERDCEASGDGQSQGECCGRIESIDKALPRFYPHASWLSNVAAGSETFGAVRVSTRLGGCGSLSLAGSKAARAEVLPYYYVHGDFLGPVRGAERKGGVAGEGWGFDVVVTTYFLDAADDVLLVLKAISRALREGGLWVNLGPLEYHDNVSGPRLSMDELLEAAHDCGLAVAEQRVASDGASFYGGKQHRAFVLAAVKEPA